MADVSSGSACGDTNQIAAAAAACQLLIARRLPPQESHPASDLRPDFDFLSDLTQQIKHLELGADSADQVQSKGDSKAKAPQSESERSELASLYCQRAQRILGFVDYDASARFSTENSSTESSDTSSSEPEEQQEEDDEHSSHDSTADDDNGLLASISVEKALEDAQTAIALAPSFASGYFLAAQCSRCLGNTSRAIEHITLALRFAPQNASDIQQLANQLAVDANESPMQSHAPPLMTPAQILAIFENANQGDDEQTEQQQDEEESGQYTTADETEAFRQTLQAGHQRLASIAASSNLAKLEQMMHQNVHHQCAARNETQDLEIAFEDTASFLWKLLGNPATISALGLADRNDSRDMLAIASSGGSARLLVENRSLRKWVSHTLAPAARRYPTQLGRAPLPSLDSLTSQDACSSRDQLEQTQEAVLAMLVRDALLILTRLLLALAGWRRCTSMPHALLYAELCSDLAKEVGAREGSFSGLSRFEMLCNDAFGRGLLELTPDHNDALQIHQESFQAALAIRDANYELRSHHFIGQAYARMGELALAHAEFSEMLELSRKFGESQIECLAQYELGDCCMQRGNLAQANVHFKLAQTLCHQTAHARGSWRPHSMQQAIAFYAAMKPSRRGAIRVVAAPSTTKPYRRRGSMMPPPPPQQKQEQEPNSTDADTVSRRKVRRPAIWIGPPKLQLEHESGGSRSLLRTLLGEQSEPVIALESSREVAGARREQTATAKLFAHTPTGDSSRPRRPSTCRDSVLAEPLSYAELKSLASAALTSPVRSSGA